VVVAVTPLAREFSNANVGTIAFVLVLFFLVVTLVI
jgi:hypothetical protein